MIPYFLAHEYRIPIQKYFFSTSGIFWSAAIWLPGRSEEKNKWLVSNCLLAPAKNIFGFEPIFVSGRYEWRPIFGKYRSSTYLRNDQTLERFDGEGSMSLAVISILAYPAHWPYWWTGLALLWPVTQRLQRQKHEEIRQYRPGWQKEVNPFTGNAGG